jgi:hypothetical protein
MAILNNQATATFPRCTLQGAPLGISKESLMIGWTLRISQWQTSIVQLVRQRSVLGSVDIKEKKQT